MVFENPERPPDSSVAIVAVTRHGTNLALQLQAGLPGSECFVPVRHRFAIAMGARGFTRIGDLLPRIWQEFGAIVCIMAAGIVVRQIAPLLHHKASDPAVVVMDEQGRFVISLLSGHLGGANALAEKVARLTGGQSVVTTASEVQNKPALDLMALKAGLEIENIDMISRVARSLLEDERIWIYDPEGRLKPYLIGEMNISWLEAPEVQGCHSVWRALDERLSMLATGDEATAGVWVSECIVPRTLSCLLLRPRNLVVGVGCNRGTAVEEVYGLILSVFERERLSLLSIRNLASVDLKSGEPGILEVGRLLGRPVHFFPRQEIENIIVPSPSSVVMRHIGVPNVCEATALLSARKGKLIVVKQKTANVTLAVARVNSPS